MQRGDIWWADLAEPSGSAPGFRRPVLLIQADAFTQSRISTVIAISLSSNLRLVQAPGNVLVQARQTGLSKDSVVNVSQIITIDKAVLDEYVGHLPDHLLREVEQGIRLVLDVRSKDG